MRSLSIVYLDRAATLLRQQLAELSRNGLIREFLVVAGENDVERLVAGEYTPTDMDNELVSAQLELIRVVALRIDRVPSEAAIQLERDTLASLRLRGQQVGIELKSYSVVVVSAGTKVSPDCFHQDWTANVVVVPEESAGGEGFIAIDLSPGKAEAVGLAALTLVAGLWSWANQGVLDDEQPSLVGGVTYLRLVRLSLRVVDAGDLTSQLIGWAMDPGGAWPIPNDYVFHDDPYEVVGNLAKLVAASPEARFEFVPFSPVNPPRPKAMGLVPAVTLFYSRLWAFIARMPLDYADKVRERVAARVEHFVQERTFGDDSSIVVRIAERPSTAAELTTTRVRAGLLTGLREVGVVAPQPTPDTWRLFRSVCFGLIDGGDFAGSLHGAEPRWLGQRAVIADRTCVAPGGGHDSDGVYFKLRALELCALGINSVGDSVLRPFDVPSVDLFVRRLTECESEARSDPTDTSWLPDMWRALVHPDMLDGPVLLVGESEDDTDVVDDDDDDFDAAGFDNEFADLEEDPSDASVSSEKENENQASDENEREAAGSDGIGSEPAVDPPSRGFLLERLRDRYDEWMENRRESFVWKLGEELQSAMDSAVHDFEQASVDFEALLAEVEERERDLSKVNRRIRRWVKFAVFLMVVLVLGAIGAWFIVAAAVAYYMLAGVAALLIGLPLAMYRSAKQLTRLEFRLEQMAHGPDLILERRRHASAEMTRLANLSDQLGDWSEIIASMVHRPWGRRGMDAGAEPWVAQSGSHVFSVGIPKIDDSALESEIVRLRQHLARKEWLSKLYVQHEAEWGKRYARRMASTPGLGIDPSADINSGARPIATVPHTGEQIFRPRRQFRIDVVSERFADVLRQERVDALRANIDDENTPAMLGAIDCDVDDLAGLESTQFLRPVVEQSPVPGFDRFINRRVGGPSTSPQFSVFGASEKVRVSVPGDGHERRELDVGGVSERYVLAAFRLDVSQSLELSDLSIAESREQYGSDEDEVYIQDDESGLG